MVFTAKPIRRRHGSVGTAEFLARHQSPEKMSGRRAYGAETPLSTSRTLRERLSMFLKIPALAAGSARSWTSSAIFRSGGRDDDLLITYAELLGNGTVFKRLGYITEQLAIDATSVIRICHSNITSGSLNSILRLRERQVQQNWGLLLNARVRP